MENWKKKFKEWGTVCFEGEVTVKKAELWLVMIICLLAGILYGLRKAPLTHGVMIGCNNGNSSGCKAGGTERKRYGKAGEDIPSENVK